MVYLRAITSLVLGVCLAVDGGLRAAEPEKDASDGRFLRIVRRGDDSPVAFETSIVRYVPRDRSAEHPTVDLVAAVHVADGAYYTELNRMFKQYDAVLYELVAPQGTRIPKGGGEIGVGDPISMLQSVMTDVLDLRFQLRAIDYTRRNFVHADMSPWQFDRSMKQRGETPFEMFTRMLNYALAQEKKDSGSTTTARLIAALTGKNRIDALKKLVNDEIEEMNDVLALFSDDRALELKRTLAEQFEDLEGSLSAINGPDGSTLITERNKVALAVLRRQLDAGAKTVAIFYGAGHMPDFDKRLKDDFDLVPTKTHWLTAWDLGDK